MSWTLVNRISIKKDGVYLSTKCSNDTEPYRAWKSETLSKVYAEEGQDGLDREIIRMSYEYIQLRGSHKSLDRYKRARNSYEASNIFRQAMDEIDERYEQMGMEDQKSIWSKPTEIAREYIQFRNQKEKESYQKIAELCKKYDKVA